MIRDRLRRLSRRVRGKPPASTGGIGPGFRIEQSADVQSLADASDAAFDRLEAVLASMPEPARDRVAQGLARGALGVRTAVRKGVTAGQASGQLGHVTAPIAAALRDAAVHLETAWEDAESLGAPAAGREALGVVRDAGGRFGGAMARLPMQPALRPALVAALERWEGMALTGLERAVMGEAGPEGT